MLSIAVIEDNDDLRGAIVGALAAEGHRVIGIDCAEALAEQGARRIDLAVIDLNLPGEDGLSLTRRLRQTDPEMGIIVMTARGRANDKRIGYESGADIYLAKPVALEELAAAISALSRRIRRKAASATLRLDMRSLTVSGAGTTRPLSVQEAALLAAFARAEEQRLETWQIMEILEHGDRAPSRNALKVTLSRLAAKLRQTGAGERPIRAIRNWGYQLCESITLA